MDTLDKVTTPQTPPLTGRYNDDDFDIDAPGNLQAQVAGKADEVVQDVKDAVRKINWWQVAGYVAAGAAVVGAVAAYANYRHEQRKPASRLERLRDQLGLSDVDFRHLRSTYNKVDFDRLNETRRHLGSAAKKATHTGALKVAEWTR
ncbi:hypothetical protein ABI_38460 [Asticcacaulis biprosthecium C19]|uniref:Uncharacterized protein n=1 Tax=Asticcacaulis biprosthecium C19 TaxID=715226 RepID=F4QRR2_9CAUL|nr:hypothetical protein [Asticcacaulis biprosthecium]EGF89432.1 hypothetical protein ABI_38460 [Asticcacaulis biprosthecium C19]